MNSPARTRVAVLKPDFGVSGGFEALLDRLLLSLDETRFDVDNVAIPGRQTPRPIWGQPDAASRWFDHPEFFTYLGMLHDLRRLDLSDYDLVVSTQPPTYLAPHHRILGLFYHQSRVFYELEDSFVEAGFRTLDLHRAASHHVRAIDSAHLGGVRHWLAGSRECASRITDAWSHPAPISILDAPPLTDVPDEPPPWNANGPVVCVSRHEWPKRTELVVAAGHLLGRPTRLIGAGGRLQHVRRLAEALSKGAADPRHLDSSWLGTTRSQDRKRPLGQLLPGRARSTSSPVSIEGGVSDGVRNQAFAEASVVLAPAQREDYGLTALEAMVWGKPVVVCSDGGGLVEIVESTGGGLIVDPTPQAIADGVRRIVDNPSLARELRERALHVRSTHTWARAEAQFLEAVDNAIRAEVHPHPQSVPVVSPRP